MQVIMKKLSIVIPAQNEEKRIARTLSRYGSFFSSKYTLSTEIIVAISDSSDNTSDIVDDYAKKYPFIKKITSPYNLGKGGAVALGFKSSTGDFIGFTDADGAVSPSEFYKLFSFLDETPWLDGAIGSRSFGETKMSFKRKLLSRLFNFYVKIFFNLPYKDTQCGAKVFRREAALSISGRLSNTGWAFDVNTLLVARYLNLRVLEFPVNWIEKEGSKFSVYVGLFKVLAEFISLKFLEIKHVFEVKTPSFVKNILPKKEISDSKNILIFAWRDLKHPSMGGAEVYVHNVAKRLAKKHNVVLFTAQPGTLSSRDTMDGVKIVRKGNFITVYIWAVIYYFKYFRKNTDFILDEENGIPFFTPLFSRKRKIMLLHHVHKDMWFKQFPFPISVVGHFLESFIMPIVYRNVKVVTVSPSSLIDLKDIGFREKNVFLAYNSIPDRVGPKFEKDKDPLISYVGRVKAYKRIEISIRAFRQVLKKFPKAKLIIGGGGDHVDMLKALVKKLNLEDSVDILGFVSERKKWEILQRSWVFTMPSMREGWGITIMEAASCGTPTLGFNVMGVRDSVRNGVTGILCNSEEIFTKSLVGLIEDKNLRKKLGENALKWETLFTWKNTADIFEDLIEKSFEKKKLLSERLYPWDLDLNSETITSLAFEE